MFPLFLPRIVSLGLVWLGTARPPATAVLRRKLKQEHILFQAIRRGGTSCSAGLRAGTPPDVRASDGTTPLMAAALHGNDRWSAPCSARGPFPRGQ